jgi:7-cyano-7-deazaguanine synthase
MLAIHDTGPVVVLFSGGLDSTVLAHMAGDRLSAVLSFAYGQPNAVPELLSAERWARSHKVRREVVSLSMFGVDSSMQLGSGAPGSRVLAGRNLLMLAHGVNFAASIGAREVWYGANDDDRDAYPDCRAEFVSWVNMATTAYGVVVRAPLLGLNKAGVVREARRLGVDIAATWSCYEPADMPGYDYRKVEYRPADMPVPCGTCNACILRAQALAP